MLMKTTPEYPFKLIIGGAALVFLGFAVRHPDAVGLIGIVLFMSGFIWEALAHKNHR
jgi:hypothetical protein